MTQSKSVKFRMITWVVFLVGGAILSVYLDLKFFPKPFKCASFHIISFVLGIILMRLVFIASKNTGRTLAKYGRKGDIPRFETDSLVTQGVYSYMRHPMHLGLFFFPLAFALVIGSPAFIFIVAPLEALLMFVMIKLYEEKEALEKFGDAYREYMKNVPGFCLKPKCLKALLTPPDSKSEENGQQN